MSKWSGFRSGLSVHLVTAAFCLSPLSAVLGEMRVWKSASGTFEVRAEMISSDAESVQLVTEDGRELSVALAKLAQADRDYVLAQAAAASKSGDATSKSDEKVKQIKQRVAQFYRAAGNDGRQLRPFLTAQGKASYDRLPAFFRDIRGPDREQRPRVMGVSIDSSGQTAVADYRIRIGGKNWQMKMLFTAEDDDWRVSGLVGPGKGGARNQMDFDNAQTTTGSASATNSINRGGKRTTSAATDVVTPGVAAYAKGMCVKCHGPSGAGTSRGPDLTDEKWTHCDGSVAGIRQVLVSGVKKDQLSDTSRPFGMNPATNLVQQSELDALAEYVKLLGVDSD